MSLHSLPFLLNQSPSHLHSLSFDPPCSLCNQSVPLENAVTDEHGLAIHESCYLRKLGLHHAPAENGLLSWTGTGTSLRGWEVEQ